MPKPKRGSLKTTLQNFCAADLPGYGRWQCRRNHRRDPRRQTKAARYRYRLDRIALPDNDRIKEAVTQALELGKGVMSIYNPETKEETLFSQHAYAFKSGLSYPPLEPHDFSFNHPLGMCPTCQGLGITRTFNLDLVIKPEFSIADDVVPWLLRIPRSGMAISTIT